MLESAFAAAYTDGNGILDQEELTAIISRLQAKPMNEFTSRNAPDPDIAIGSAKKKERRRMLNGWQIMYCGGAPPVVAQLQQISKKYQVRLKVESFAW